MNGGDRFVRRITEHGAHFSDHALSVRIPGIVIRDTPLHRKSRVIPGIHRPAGAIGAFAITSDPIIIALGLGLIGAIFVRSLTVFMVRRRTLDSFVHLEHGAHWAIGALAVILLISMSYHLNEFVTGLVGVVFIGAAVWTSLIYRKKHLTTKKA